MKKILLLSLSVFTTLSLSAQISIHVGSDLTDVSGTTVDITIDPNVVNEQGDYFWTEHFIVTNNTGADGLWTITRKKVNVPATWNDQLCWPPTCYPTSGDVYTTPHNPGGANPAPTVLDGTSIAEQYPGDNYIAEIKPQVTPDFTMSGGATYTYYVTDAVSGTYLDSITVNLSYPLSVEENKTTTLSIAPNPANEYVALSLEGAQSAQVKIVDVLGNIVYSKNVNASTKINVAEFRNGIYFVTIEGDNKKTTTKKLIVKH